MNSLLRRLLNPVLATTLAATACLLPGMALADGEVNIYSNRQEFLIRPFLDSFTEKTGITVNVVFAKTGILERLKAEGDDSPADLVLTVDIARLSALSEAGVLQPVKSLTLNDNIPAQYRHPDGLWFGLTTRARLLYVSKERVKPGTITRYEQLAEPEWKDRVCMRTSKHVYNRALLASIIAAHGPDAAKTWAEGLKANQARKPQGNDRAQVQAVKNGFCDVALGNNYYYGKMKFNDKKPEQKEWADAVYLVFPNQEDRGTHVNISGVAMTKAAKNQKQAQMLMEFLSSEFAQQMYASTNYEYPVNPKAEWDKEVISWGTFKADTVPLDTIADLSVEATRIFNEVGFD